MCVKQKVTKLGRGQPSRQRSVEGTEGLKYRTCPRGVADWLSVFSSAKSANSSSNASCLGADPWQRSICLFASSRCSTKLQDSTPKLESRTLVPVE